MPSGRLFTLGVALGVAPWDVGSQPQVVCFCLCSVKRKEGRQGWRVNQMPEIRCCETSSCVTTPTSKDISKVRLKSQEKQ